MLSQRPALRTHRPTGGSSQRLLWLATDHPAGMVEKWVFTQAHSLFDFTRADAFMGLKYGE